MLHQRRWGDNITSMVEMSTLDIDASSLARDASLDCRTSTFAAIYIVGDISTGSKRSYIILSSS